MAWALARKQHGVITRRQLLALGFTTAAIRHRLAEGRLHRVYPGVYAVGRPELSQNGRWMAAVLACGETAALSHDSAAAIWNIGRQGAKVHVSVLGDSRSRDDIEVHRRTELRATTLNGIRVTTPAQTLVELARTWPHDQVEQAIGEAQMRRLVTLQELREAATGRAGAALRRIIDDTTFRVTQSDLERAFLRLVKKTGLPLPETQERIGRHRVDFFWPQIGLVVETDGANFHRTARQQQLDRERDQEHIRAGRTPLRVTHAQVVRDTAGTAALLAAIVERLAAAEVDRLL